MNKKYFNKIYFPKNLIRTNKIFLKNITTRKNNIHITPFLLWKTINLYDGKKYKQYNITKHNIGYKIKFN